MSEFLTFIASAAAAMAVAFTAGWIANSCYRRAVARRKARSVLRDLELQWSGDCAPAIKLRPRFCRGTNLRGRDFRGRDFRA